jgi:hypothetical protein
MRRDIATQNNQRMQAQQAMLNSYRQGQLGLGQQRVENQENFQDQRAADAAMSYRDEQGFANAIANGMTPQQALFQFPRAKASMVSALTRTGTGGAEELMLRRIGAQSASRDLDQADRAIQAFQSKWGGNLPVPPELQQQRDEARARVQRLLGDRSGLSDAVPAASPAASQPMSLPKSKDQLKDGQIYQTSKGPAKWNASSEQFMPVTGSTQTNTPDIYDQ